MTWYVWKETHNQNGVYRWRTGTFEPEKKSVLTEEEEGGGGDKQNGKWSHSRVLIKNL